MQSTQTIPAVSAAEARGFDTAALRRAFLMEGLFAPGEIRLRYTHYDRMILGGVVPPAGGSLRLDHMPEAGTACLTDRREVAVVAIAGAGTVETAGAVFAMEAGDVLYVGKGSGCLLFSGEARFYLVSAPAHAALPARLLRPADAKTLTLGAAETANHRTIHQFVHPDVMESCQLVLGYTRFHGGSVWNTMPAHRHDRRMEAYLYFDLAPAARVFHMMGEPQETRHLVVANEEAVVSPPWSIHCGCGTGSYAFIWAMAGDNVDYRDMDMIAMEDLR